MANAVKSTTHSPRGPEAHSRSPAERRSAPAYDPDGIATVDAGSAGRRPGGFFDTSTLSSSE
jgi:hypothetical protein